MSVLGALWLGKRWYFCRLGSDTTSADASDCPSLRAQALDGHVGTKPIGCCPQDDGNESSIRMTSLPSCCPSSPNPFPAFNQVGPSLLSCKMEKFELADEHRENKTLEVKIFLDTWSGSLFTSNCSSHQKLLQTPASPRKKTSKGVTESSTGVWTTAFCLCAAGCIFSTSSIEATLAIPKSSMLRRATTCFNRRE